MPRVGSIAIGGSTRRPRRRGDGPVAAVMMLPAVTLFTLFVIWPFLRGLWISLQRWDGFSPPVFVGLANYLRLAHNGLFAGAFENNLVFVAAVLVLKNGLGLGLAILLDRAPFFRGALRAAVFIPVTLSFVAAGLLWSWIYNPIFGLLNAGLSAVGLATWTRAWLGDAQTALGAIIVVDVWKWLGFHAVIYLAGLQTIPSDLYDAARVDGAKALRRFWHVTLPLIMPVMLVNIILSLSGAFVRNFDVVQVLTQGGPNHATEVVMTLMVKEAFQNGNMGYASAMGYALFLVVGLVCVALIGLVRRTRLVL